MAKQLSLSTTRALTKQLVELSTTKPCEGIAVDFSEDNIREIFAEMEGPTGTPFEGGVFRVKLLLGDDFPDAPPKGYFLTKVFHPNISEGGDICVNVLKKDWKADLGIRHVLLVESALNEEAGRLLLEDYESFCKRAQLMTRIHAAPNKRPMPLATRQATGDNVNTGSASVSPSKGQPCGSPVMKKAKGQIKPTGQGPTAAAKRRALKRL